MNAQVKIKLVETYFERMTAGDIDGIIQMFESDASITSPFLGVMKAADFFIKLGKASAESKLTVFDILLGEENSSAAAHFQYDWKLASGENLTFKGIDYFTFSKNGKFQSMSIFYDTHPLREQVGDKYANA